MTRRLLCLSGLLALVLVYSACSNGGEPSEERSSTSTATSASTSEATTATTVPKDIRVPDVVGQPVRQARQELQDAGLTSSLASSAAPGNVVTRQKPKMGSFARPGDNVTLWS